MNSLDELLLQSIRQYPDNKAVKLAGEAISYQELFQHAFSLIKQLQSCQEDTVALLATKSIASYSAIAAIALSGKTYLPLTSKDGLEQVAHMLEVTGTKTVIVDKENQGFLEGLQKSSKQQFAVVLLSEQKPVSRKESLQALAEFKVPKSADAYLMFTSGSTGRPKGISVPQKSVIHYLQVMQERYQPTARDRFTQIIDLTFDLSIHDIFLCWSVGACLLGFSGSNYFQLAAYLKNERPTFSLMVPSTALALMRSRLLKENDYASLVTVLFCGEALPVALAKQWQLASPKARVENIYGPTEATIAFTAYQYSESDLKLQQQALVPIGQALPGLRTKVVRQDFTDCEIDEAGELLLAGPQLVSGYVNNLQKTVKQFIYLQGRIWYRTGDLACLDNSGNLHYQGRLDQQLQIRGQRVERLDLEERFKKSLNLQHLVIIPSPVTEEGLVLGVALIFLTMEEVSVAELRKRCQNDSELAFFPSEYIALDSFPLNRNSKVDYQALVRRYQKTDKMSSKEKVLV